MRWLTKSKTLLPNNQLGFRPLSSCTDSLITLTNYIRGGFIDNASTVCMFLDIEGAFDNVAPSILLEDLFQLGIPVKTRKFISNAIFK